MKARVMKWLWFPQSEWLAQHWWHRLATVVFWAWGLFWLYLLLVITTDEEWRNCLRNNPTDQDIFCGSNPWSGMFLSGVQSVHLPAFLIATVAGLFVPTVLYRIVLFVATGEKWKD